MKRDTRTPSQVADSNQVAFAHRHAIGENADDGLVERLRQLHHRAGPQRAQLG
ncbi:hypothetical protein ACU4HD_43725 [Cupriavidus basilensis]